MSRGTGDYSQTPDKLMGDDVLCVAVHGDAAFAGQVKKFNQFRATISHVERIQDITLIIKWNVTPLLGHFGGRVGICSSL